MTFALVIVLVFAVLGAPLFAVFGGAALELFSSGGLDTTGVAIDVFGDKFANSPTLVTIPLFTFAGYLMAESGTPKRLVEVSRAVFGWLPGGLAMVALAASAFFTTFTGGSGITIVAVGGLLYPALLSDRYPKSFSLGLVTTGGSLGLLFPPSLPIILYAVVANIDVDPLFLAGVVPGLVTVAALFLYSLVLARRSKVPSTKFDLRAAGRAIWMAKWELLLPVALVAGLLGGLRIHEASAFTAVYVLVVQCFVYKDLSVRRDVPRIVRESMTMVGAILAILACALGFTSFLIQAEVPAWILDKMESLITSQFMFLLVLNLFLLVVGMLMDIFSAIVVVVPLIVPIANHFCVHPV
ncbi:MAG: TRAP transporter large permease subunit, partial [Deltaproteobacteria bacterium]|nr:TRAP transporter large permease subunit [Deltaproteobacteria bacterium]